MSDEQTTRRAMEIREQTGQPWEIACSMAERERNIARRVDTAHAAADAAFWEQIALNFPGAPGDFGPEETTAWESASRAAVMTWVANNAPDLPEPITCRHCGENVFGHVAGDDGTCPTCQLRDVLAGSRVLADGEAVDAYDCLSAAVDAFLAGKSADEIHAAAQIDAPQLPDYFGRTYIAVEGDTFAGEPITPGTLLAWDATAQTHYPASVMETRRFAESIGFAPSDVWGRHMTYDALRGMLAAYARRSDRRDWVGTV